MKTTLFADDTVLVQSDNNLGMLLNSVNREMTKVMDWLTANKLPPNISKTKYMLITNKCVSMESFVTNVNTNRIERTLTYKHACSHRGHSGTVPLQISFVSPQILLRPEKFVLNIK